MPDTMIGDVKAGDVTAAWVALADARPVGDEIVIHVQYPDGGDGFRAYSPLASVLVEPR